MKISWNWLSEMLDLSQAGGPKGLAEILTARGLEVEAIERQDAGLEKVVTAKILERAPHPQADRLSLCKVTSGPGGQGEPLEIVCGAQNMKAGDVVALAQVGAHLPNGVTIAQSKIRGVVSNGMLCSEEELHLKDSSEGILILPPKTELGRPLAQILGRDDTILAFKLTANRGDCLSHFGIAREAAAAFSIKTGTAIKPRRPEAKLLAVTARAPISVELAAGDDAPQFFGCLIDGVKIGPSPKWVVKRLESLGSRSINNVVDASNLVMLELGHPVHAYDAEKIEGNRIQVRRAREGEKLPLLDGTEITLDGFELVIGDAKRAIGLAGVMGGGNSEVSADTKKIYLEAAEFSPTLVRKASSRHQKKTEAAHRFERGVDPAAIPHVIARLAALVVELAGGKVLNASMAHTESRRQREPRRISVPLSYFEDFLGMPATAERVEKALLSLECEIRKPPKGDWSVAIPSFRNDLVIREDLAEEVARSLGYGEIRETIPPLSGSPTTVVAESSAARFALLGRAKGVLLSQGLLETLNYGFTSGAWLKQLGISGGIPLSNPMTEEWDTLTPSLLPGLLRNALEGWNHHFGSEPLALRFFEIRPTFHAGAKIGAVSETETGITEKWKLALALSGPRFAGGLRNARGEVDFFDLKAIVENLLSKLGTKGVRFQPLNASRAGGHPLFHPGQSVEVLAGKDVAGTFGLLHPGKARELKTRAPLWLAELDWDAIAHLSRPVTQAPAFRPWSQFPPIERDFALVVKQDVTADKITQVALKVGKPLAKIARVFDVYRGPQVQEGMTSVAVRVIFYDESRSLQESEAEAVSAQILEGWKRELGAELRG